MVSPPLPLPKLLRQPQPCASRLLAHVLRGRGAVRLAEGVAAGDQGHGLLVVHGHAAEGVANVLGGEHRVGPAVGAFGVDVDQAHLHGGERVLEIARVHDFAVVLRVDDAVAFNAGRALRIALVAAQPLRLAAPVHVEVGLPHVGPAAGEAEGLEAHALKRDVAGEDDQVGPGNLAAVLLLDGPEQATRLVEAHVVGPAAERREALRAAAGATAPVTDAIRARAVPGHADEERAVVAEVGRPPVLRVGHQRVQVLLDGGEIEALERLGVVEVGVHRIRLRRMLAQQVEPHLVRPPVAVRGAAAGGLVKGAFGFGAHRKSPRFGKPRRMIGHR